MKKIVNAQYVQDGGASNTTVNATFDDGSQQSIPVGGSTWLNPMLDDYLEGGGMIAAAPKPQGE